MQRLSEEKLSALIDGKGFMTIDAMLLVAEVHEDLANKVVESARRFMRSLSGVDKSQLRRALEDFDAGTTRQTADAKRGSGDPFG